MDARRGPQARERLDAMTAAMRKRKGIANVKLEDGRLLLAEIHGYEGHGVGRKELKIKRFLKTA